jgi:hypothetical protein
MNTVISIRTGEVLVQEPKEYIRQAYTTTNGAKCTNKYAHIQTEGLYRAIEALGYAQVQSSSSKKAGEHSRHITIFEKSDILFEGCKPRVIVDNSHDGTKALYVRFGLFRMYCANGLVLGTDIVKPLRIIHSGTPKDLERQVYDFVAQATFAATALYDSMQHKLSAEQITEFAQKAFDLRYEGKFTISQRWLTSLTYDPSYVREQDHGASLWAIYNRVQEALMSGKLVSKSRAITSPRRAIDFNNDLNNLAMQYAA